jgi:hypothetical protein
MNSYKITAILRDKATYDEHDGYGDYVNYSEQTIVSELPAESEADAVARATKAFPMVAKHSMGTVKAILVVAQ